MKKLFLICLAVGLSARAFAQRGYFLYLQTDDQSPFYVRMADKIYSSSTAGYLILPNLTDSTYTFGVGFARSTQPETRFAVTINQNDKGYLIKAFTEGLALFNLQDLSIVKSLASAKDNTVYETKTDRFSSVLSKAADDPGLLKVPVAKKEEPKVEPEKKEPVVVKTDEAKPKPEEKAPVTDKTEVARQNTAEPRDTSVAKREEVAAIKTEKKEEPVKTELKPEPTTQTSRSTEESKKPETKPEVMVATDAGSVVQYKPSKIVRRSESSTTEGFGVVFLDKMDDRTDTIRILIPPAKASIDDEAQAANFSQIEKRNDTAVALTDQQVQEKPVMVKETPVEVKPKTEEQKAIATTSGCKESATDKDFMKLRKNMAAENNDEAMVDQAKKVFRNKCFSVEQIRYLSTLFLTSAAKYQFFDAAYNHVSDKQNFPLLQGEIKDEYYLKRFKALVGE